MVSLDSSVWLSLYTHLPLFPPAQEDTPFSEGATSGSGLKSWDIVRTSFSEQSRGPGYLCHILRSQGLVLPAVLLVWLPD